MNYRSGLEIKKRIIETLKEGKKVISQMERKLNTSNKVLKRHLAELEYLGIIKTTKHERSEKTGRPYTTAEIKRGIIK